MVLPISTFCVDEITSIHHFALSVSHFIIMEEEVQVYSPVIMLLIGRVTNLCLRCHLLLSAGQPFLSCCSVVTALCWYVRVCVHTRASPSSLCGYKYTQESTTYL
jgi:hypothetical protein